MSTEQQTRKNIIDKALTSAGWNVADPTQVILELNIVVNLPEGITEPQRLCRKVFRIQRHCAVFSN